MKKLIVAVAAGLSAVVLAAKLDGIAARVDSAVITVGDVMAEIRRNPEISGRMIAADESEMQALYRAALDNLVERRLILKAAAEKKVEIPEWVIDNQLREIVNHSFGGDKNRLHEEMARSKVPMTEYRNTVKEDILVRGMRQQMIEQFVTASPAAMKKEFADHPDRYRQEAKVSVRVILLKPGKDGDGVPSLETRWAQIGEELAKGEKFSDMAIKYSADSHAKDGGLWKDVNPEEAFRPEIANAIAKLDVGRVSNMIDLDGWGFIVKKESETKAKQMSFAEAYDKIAENVQKAAAKKAYDEWIVRLKDMSFIKVYPMPKE
ncbi:MAG: peptidyl-prolyl cis-trans isomerase [Kiritimatiellae bacterium]|nr:peptidyl-prolyl cis-trans isomerase [Kiritimatiellia bacterium]